MRRVLLLEDDLDLREGLADLLQIMGAEEVVAAASFDDLVAQGDRALGSDVAFLDVNLGANVPSGVDAFRWLQDHGFEGRVVFLTGHARSHPLVKAAKELGVLVVEKPVGGETLEELAAGA
ncbi:response regulator [Vulgatibacter sp.]|uniref:response regulator n=1 Tax=Vulgatibacter sp. TaxID=1971226 RepID=UPI003565767E